LSEWVREIAFVCSLIFHWQRIKNFTHSKGIIIIHCNTQQRKKIMIWFAYPTIENKNFFILFYYYFHFMPTMTTLVRVRGSERESHSERINKFLINFICFILPLTEWLIPKSKQVCIRLSRLSLYLCVYVLYTQWIFIFFLSTSYIHAHYIQVFFSILKCCRDELAESVEKERSDGEE
jgi:hypothetical protein